MRFVIFCLLLTFTAQAEDIFNRGNGNEPTTLNVNNGSDFHTCAILRDIYETLVVNDDAKVIPAAATHWEVSNDGKEIVFHLRTQAKWSNGDPVTAEDFVRSWRRVVTPAIASPYAEHMVAVVNAKEIYTGKKQPDELGVKALDAHRLKVSLVEATPHFLSLMVHTPFSPIHKSSADKDITAEAKSGKLISNGAFSLQDWKPNEYLLVKRNPHYWDHANVKLDGVKYYPIEGDTELNMYRAGQLDYVSEVDNQKIPFIRKDKKLSNDFTTAPWYAVAYVGLNLTKAPFKDNPKIREALSLVVDRDIIVNKIMYGGETAAYSWIHPQTNNNTPAYLYFKDWDSEKRLKRAQELYKEAGYSKENPFKVEILTAAGRNRNAVTTAIANMWKKALGVEVSILKQETKVYFQERRLMKNTEAYMGGLIGLYNDPQTLAECRLSGSGINDLGFKSAEYDQLVEQASHTQDMKKRSVLYAKAERIFLDSHAMIPLYFYAYPQLVKPYIKGYNQNLMGLMYSKRLWMDHSNGFNDRT
jgi:oligopeptide transport system substrate-binding protein